MASTAIQIMAPRQLVASVRWTGGNAAYGLLRHWAKRCVELDSKANLYLQTDEGVEFVPIGNYIVLVGDYFHNFSPEDMEMAYVRVYAE